MNIPNSLIRIFNSIQFSHPEHIFLQNIRYHVTPFVQLFCQLSSINIEYPNLGFNSSSLKFLVLLSARFRTTLHHTVLWIFHSSPFLTECIILEIFLVYLVSLPLLAIHTVDLLINIIIGACSGITYGYLFNNSLFSILKCDRSIAEVCAVL